MNDTDHIQELQRQLEHERTERQLTTLLEVQRAIGLSAPNDELSR